jgi:DNA mismatch repair ATPase MutS
MEIDKLIEELEKLEGDKLKKFQEALKKTNVDLQTSEEKIGSLEKAYVLLGESVSKAKDDLKAFKDSQMDMANVNLEVAKATNDYIAEVEAGAKIFDMYQEEMEEAAKRVEDGTMAQEDFNQKLDELQKKYRITRAEAAKYKKQSLELTDAFKEGGKSGEDFAMGLGTAMGILSPKAMGMYKSFMKFASIAKRKDGIKGIVVGLKKIVNPTNLALGALALITTQTLKYAMAVDQATAAFAKQTGAGRALTAEIMAV